MDGLHETRRGPEPGDAGQDLRPGQAGGARVSERVAQRDGVASAGERREQRSVVLRQAEPAPREDGAVGQRLLGGPDGTLDPDDTGQIDRSGLGQFDDRRGAAGLHMLGEQTVQLHRIEAGHGAGHDASAARASQLVELRDLVARGAEQLREDRDDVRGVAARAVPGG